MLCIFSLTVLESFEDYVSVETLDGENKYDAGDHGLQVNTAQDYCMNLVLNSSNLVKYFVGFFLVQS